MSRIEWTRSALSDLAGIYEYVAKDSPRYALRVIDRLTSRTYQITAFPYSGEMVPEYQREDVREVIEYSYRLIYLIDVSAIYILAVIHGAQPLPDTTPQKDG